MTTTANAGDIEKEAGDTRMSPVAASRFWQVQLELSDRDHKEWVREAERIEARYKSEKKALAKISKGSKRLNILYSNTETLVAALYARTPKPDVRRRFADRDPIARMGADIIERALAYCADTTAHDQVYRRGVKDMVLPGRGVIRYEYEPTLSQVPRIDPMTGQPAIHPETGEAETEEAVTDQEVYEEYVFWNDFRHAPARNYEGWWWIAFRHRMTREELRENEFEDADSVSLNWTPEPEEKNDKHTSDEIKRAEVWEIWDRRTKTRYWITKGHAKALRIDEDPYGLEQFYPIAEPLFATLGNDTSMPTPDYVQYEDQADDLDEITGRISSLTKALKRRGVYDSSVPELKRLARAGDNEFIPTDKMQMLASKGGLAVAFQQEDIAPIAVVLKGLYEQRAQLVQAIYEVTGISDIMRGSTNANETATAQNIKAQFGSMRLKDRQREVQRWVRDGYRIKAELLCEHFEPQKLAEITGLNAQDPNFMQAVQLIKQDKARAYAIDIETDSTIFEDAEQEKQSRVEMLKAISDFTQQWVPVVQAAPEMGKLFFEMLSFGVRGFKAGKQLEDAIDQTAQAMIQRLSNPPPPPPPDPAVMKVEAEMKRDEASHQLDMQGKQMDLQAKGAELQMKQQGQVMDFQAQQAKTQLDLRAMQAKALMAKQQPAGRPN